ncbi:MAG: LLM class flavin-dependent oxidoreductase, partial [Gaiellaceae bacterium]
MKFSYATLLDYPLADSMEMIKTADELGYHACYAADETWHKDLWLLYAAAADKTENVRFGPNLSGIYLREPTLLCQALATLDELTGGRAEGVISCGNFGLLSQYGVDWKTIKPFSRVKEAHHVMRTFLDEGAITYDGEFYRYNGLFTFARPVQERLPLYVGAMRGPKSMQLAGEVSDGVHSALGYNKAWYDYVVE